MILQVWDDDMNVLTFECDCEEYKILETIFMNTVTPICGSKLLDEMTIIKSHLEFLLSNCELSGDNILTEQLGDRTIRIQKNDSSWFRIWMLVKLVQLGYENDCLNFKIEKKGDAYRNS